MTFRDEVLEAVDAVADEGGYDEVVGVKVPRRRLVVEPWTGERPYSLPDDLSQGAQPPHRARWPDVMHRGEGRNRAASADALAGWLGPWVPMRPDPRSRTAE